MFSRILNSQSRVFIQDWEFATPYSQQLCLKIWISRRNLYSWLDKNSSFPWILSMKLCRYSSSFSSLLNQGGGWAFPDINLDLRSISAAFWWRVLEEPVLEKEKVHIISKVETIWNCYELDAFEWLFWANLHLLRKTNSSVHPCNHPRPQGLPSV